VDRAEAEAVYDAGREACVGLLLALTSAYDAQIARLEERIRRLEEQARRDSRTSSKPPSQDPPKTRRQRRAEARAKAKELLAREGAERKAGGQEGHRGAGRKLAPEDRVDEIVEHYPDICRARTAVSTSRRAALSTRAIRRYPLGTQTPVISR
jgi:HK97 family phage major capsid protein